MVFRFTSMRAAVVDGLECDSVEVILLDRVCAWAWTGFEESASLCRMRHEAAESAIVHSVRLRRGDPPHLLVCLLYPGEVAGGGGMRKYRFDLANSKLRRHHTPRKGHCSDPQPASCDHQFGPIFISLYPAAESVVDGLSLLDHRLTVLRIRAVAGVFALV
jgi:hypothetical protein